MSITFSNRGWTGYKHNQTNKAKAKRKSKRNRAWKAIHKAAKRAQIAKIAVIEEHEMLKGKSLLIKQFAEDNNIPVIEMTKSDTTPNFLGGIRFRGKDE